MSPEDPLLEVSVVAKRLKRCPETILRYIRSGRLEAIQPARFGPYLIAESMLVAFLLATRGNNSRHDRG